MVMSMEMMKRKLIAVLLMFGLLLSFIGVFGMPVAEASPDWKQMYFDVIKEAIAHERSGRSGWLADTNARYPAFISGFMLADFNFDGIPELIIIGDGVSASDMMGIFTASSNGVDRIFLDWGNVDLGGLDWWEEDYYTVNLYQSLAGDDLKYRIYSFNGNEHEIWGNIFISDKFTPVDQRFTESTRKASFRREFIYSDNFVHLSTVNVFLDHSTGVEREVSDNIYFDLINGLTDGYDRVNHILPVLSRWDHNQWPNIPDSAIWAFLDSYISETGIFGIDTSDREQDIPVVQTNYRIIEEPFTWLGRTTDELERMVGPYGRSYWISGPLFSFGDFWFGFSDYLDIHDQLSDREEDDEYLPLGYSNRVDYMYLSNIIFGIPASGVTPDELSSVFGHSAEIYIHESPFGSEEGFYYDEHDIALDDAVIFSYGGVEVSIWTNFSVYGDLLFPNSVTALAGDSFTSPNQAGQYETERRPGEGQGGSGIANPDDLREINDAESADRVIEDVITSMTPEQRESGDALDETALFLENAISRGSGEGMPRDGELGADVLGNLTGNANEIMNNTQTVLDDEDISLLRDMRTDVSVRTDDREAFQVTFPDDVSDIGFDNVVIESEFASVKLPNSSINIGDSIEVRNLEFDESSGAEQSDRGFRMIDYWSVSAMLAFMVLWGVLWLNDHKFKAWVIPTFCVLAVGANVLTYIILSGTGVPVGLGRERTTDTIEVVMSEGMNAVVSLPATEAEKDTLVMFNADGEPQLSKYNPVTGTIDTSISESGVYELREYSVDFNDIEDKDAMMKEAITQLASRNIMTGNAEGAFNPDDLITRAEFISAAIRVFDMLDYDAVTGFIDVTRSDWYYHAVATAEQENLMSGYEDNTFRGDNRIPKDLMVVITANMLIEQMGYIVPADIEAELQRYLDREEIERWSEDGIALATQANILIYRIDGLFAPQSTMIRGDAAIVLYRVFNKVW